jgi:UDP-N-acetylglucosamine--dolichyl-phosphate N-acetylglucosaminephosphotransferase
MLELVLLLTASFIVTLLMTPALITRMKRAGIMGKDMNKHGNPPIPEMGGIAIVAGLVFSILLAIALNTFFSFPFNLTYILAALITILMISLIGIFDDLFVIQQGIKAVLPLAAAIPLVAVMAAGSTSMSFPFIGHVDFGIFYVILLIPIGVAVCSNLMNMLAGFNGLEAGMGAVVFACMAVVAIASGNVEMSILFIPLLGSLLAFLLFNRYPAKIFIGDVGTFTMGAVLASGVIIGNLETAGAMLMIPYVADFFIKLVHRLMEGSGGSASS